MDLRQVANAIRRGAPLSMTPARLPRNKFARFAPPSSSHPLQTTIPIRTLSDTSKVPQGPTDSRSQDDRANPNAQRSNQADQQRIREQELMDLLQGNTGPSRRTNATATATRTTDARAFIHQQNRSPASWVNEMNMPRTAGRANAMPALPSSAQPPDTRPAPFRLGPTLGRTFEVGRGPGADLARGLRMLDGRMRRDSVKNDWFRSRFHERPGLRRKRLKSERWRARFKLDFQATVSRVRELTRKGW